MICLMRLFIFGKLEEIADTLKFTFTYSRWVLMCTSVQAHLSFTSYGIKLFVTTEQNQINSLPDFV